MQARDEQGRLKREALRNAAPWARSVIVCALNYNTSQPYSTQVNDPERGWISRYGWGREDYHDAVMRRLRTVEEALYHACGDQPRFPIRESAAGTSPGGSEAAPALQTRCYVDTGPIVERVFARYAGVGWIGKNTCIINQRIGSWIFLGVILTSLELEADLPAADRCGSCTRCIDACPTDALVAPYQLDSNKCISYLTIEKRGEIPQDLRSGIGQQVFGCDICQDVCPWNRKAPATTATEFEPRPELVNPALEWLAQMNPDEFGRVFKGSPIRRAKRRGLRRNAVIAMGNSKNPEFLPLLEKLTKDEDETVADSAEWATKKLLHPPNVFVFSALPSHPPERS
jgi:epoxyqueuosine reductase